LRPTPRAFRLLLDENLPRKVATELRARGFDADHATDVGLRSASDREVLGRAVSEGSVCITLDRDLHRILAQTAAAGPSVILLRNVRVTPHELAALIEAAVEQIGEQLANGVAATVMGKTIRVRRLPLRIEGA